MSEQATSSCAALSRRLYARTYLLFVLTVLLLSGVPTTSATAQMGAGASHAKTVPFVMLSDFHFDPFHDPAKVPLLAKASIDQWKQILDAPDSAEQGAQFMAVQKTCKAKVSTDTPYPLLRSSLLAAKTQAPSAVFVTVSGDLLVHDLDCRYRATMGLQASKGDDQSASAAFAEKTTMFVMQQVESTFHKVPVYFALGNNDSRCNHNRLDLNDAYLAASAPAVIEGFRGVSALDKSKALHTYEAAGYYALTMPAPMVRTRLLVVNDLYMMPKYATCEADEKDQTGAQEQLNWLEKQLEDAHAKGERIWLLGHLPPAVNPASSLASGDSFCSTGEVETYQATDDFADELATHADVVKLGIFGHTHMDELHLLRGAGTGVPVKVVASVSPVSGSRPSFTVGLIDPASSKLMDYSVFQASNSTGVGAIWAKEYAFHETYHEPDFSPESLSNLISRLRADPTAGGDESQAYQKHFMKESSGKKLSSNWAGYVCSLDNPTAKTFKACVCRGK